MKKTPIYAVGLFAAFAIAAGIFGNRCKNEPTVEKQWPLTEADSALWVGQRLAKDLGWPVPEKAAHALSVIVKRQHDEEGTSYREMYSAPVFQDAPALNGQ